MSYSLCIKENKCSIGFYESFFLLLWRHAEVMMVAGISDLVTHEQDSCCELLNLNNNFRNVSPRAQPSQIYTNGTIQSFHILVVFRESFFVHAMSHISHCRLSETASHIHIK